MLFTTTNGSALNISDFIANSGGYLFAADVIGPSGNTGEVAANGPGTISNSGGNPVPEPASLVLLGGNLLAFGGARRFLRRSRNPFCR